MSAVAQISRKSQIQIIDPPIFTIVFQRRSHVVAVAHSPSLCRI